MRACVILEGERSFMWMLICPSILTLPLPLSNVDLEALLISLVEPSKSSDKESVTSSSLFSCKVSCLENTALDLFGEKSWEPYNGNTGLNFIWPVK